MQKEMKFPEGFYWGAATASYQVEGGIENCDWAQAAREGKVPICGKACDHYNRYEEDFDIAKSLGHNAHRFSIEWARIEPEEGKFDMEAIEHYKDVLTALRARNIEPFITLWHFTLPIWFAEKGGFEHRQAPKLFARYCAFVVEHLSDLCTHYATINEPNVFATHGNLYGAWPPFNRGKILWKTIGKEDGTSEKTGATASFGNILRYFKVADRLTQAHIAAYRAIKSVAPEAQVSVVKHVHYFHGHKHVLHRLRARLMTYFQSTRYLNKVKHYLDEIGLNYYRNTGYGEDRTYRLTDMGWKMAPEYIYEVLLGLKKYNKPVIVSEAGLADEDDSDRAEYITKQVEGTWKAIQDGVDVRGHMYWSLLDNYEWALGFEKRFGLVEINYETLERNVRPSAYAYKKICEDNGILQ